MTKATTPIVRDADATRARLVEAAADEFSKFGLAGARVDRIAAAASSNKAQIYHYFGSKDGLASAVFSRFAEESLETEYFDATDLAETAARIFDQFEDDVRIARVALWLRLEATETARAVVEANAAKISAIADAQRAGLVTATMPAEVLLGFVLTAAATWGALPLEFDEQLARFDRTARRAFVVAAVSRLVAP